MNTKLKQIWIGSEETEGVPPSIVPLTVAEAKWALDPQATPDYEEITDLRVAESLAEIPSRIGQRRFEFTYGLDLKTKGHNSGIPNEPTELTDSLLASGMRLDRTFYVGAAAITPGGSPVVSNFIHRETFSQAVTGATGRFIGSYSALIAGNRVYYETINGIALNATNIVTGSRGASFTPASSTVAHGYKFSTYSKVISAAVRSAWVGTPQVGEVVRGVTSGAAGVLISNTTPNLSPGVIEIEVQLGTFLSSDVPGPREGLIGATSGATCTFTSTLLQTHGASASQAFLLDGLQVIASGCRYNCKIPLRTGAPMRCDFTGKGFQVSVLTLPIPPATYDRSRAARFVDARWVLQELDATGNPTGFALPLKLSNCEIDFGNQLALRDDENAIEGGISYRIPTRASRITVDPELVVPQVYDFLGKASNEILSSVFMRFGVAENALKDYHLGLALGQGLWIDIPAIQLAKVDFGDRNGIATAQIPGKIVGPANQTDGEIALYFM